MEGDGMPSGLPWSDGEWSKNGQIKAKEIACDNYRMPLSEIQFLRTPSKNPQDTIDTNSPFENKTSRSMYV